MGCRASPFLAKDRPRLRGRLWVIRVPQSRASMKYSNLNSPRTIQGSQRILLRRSWETRDGGMVTLSFATGCRSVRCGRFDLGGIATETRGTITPGAVQQGSLRRRAVFSTARPRLQRRGLQRAPEREAQLPRRVAALVQCV